jgi:cellulose synthase/poly-beta-1,6-N-acetylglucosamine synthase-like glycosyltransferase
MANLISCFFLALAVLLAVPVSVFVAQVIAGILLPQPFLATPPASDSRGRVAILVPAHNESIGLLLTLEDIKSQMHAHDRLLVVADNCSDDTAAVATSAGAEVISRDDAARSGKGYALDYGLNYLSADAPDIVVFIDADCRLGDRLIDRLTAECAATNRPIQALYLMKTPGDSPIKSKVAEFAWRVKNWARPLGLAAVGLPCQLMGTGMAFSWEVIRAADLASAAIVEDMKLGIDLALTGNPPLFCPSAVVSSEFPSSLQGIQSQRLRWEHGHIAMIFAAAPRLIFEAMAQRQINLLAMALDLAVPPLSLLGMLVTGMVLISSLAFWLGLTSSAMIVSAATFIALLGGTLIAWLRYGRDILPLTVASSIIIYLIQKLPIYGRFMSRGSIAKWVRTDRRKD